MAQAPKKMHQEEIEGEAADAGFDDDFDRREPIHLPAAVKHDLKCLNPDT
jgi:hypothetical protein